MAPTHDSKVAAPLVAANSGNVTEAVRALDASAGKDKDGLLYNLERGELLRIDARYDESQAAFQVADAKVKQWEETAKTTPDKLIGQLGATILGESFKTYEGQDYEKVMLTTRMAMNYVSLGDLDTARVDIKRTHEREAVIMEFRAKQTVTAEEEAKAKGITGQAKELNGYPIETLNDPEVLQLKNGYQNALSHYLAGFVYETLNESGLAAPGYRMAIELRPGNPVLEEGLRGLDRRTSSARPRGVTDVLFVVESGNAPARKSARITFPVPTRNGAVVVPLAFPVIMPNPSAVAIDQIVVGERPVPAALIADFNVMARRALKDELPGVQLRAAIRAIGKGVIQEQLNKQSAVLGAIGNVAAMLTEAEADDRMWRSLPERVYLARTFIAPGMYSIRVPGTGAEDMRIAVEGRSMVVPIRILQGKTYYAQPKHFGTALPALATDVPALPTTKASGAAATKANARSNVITRPLQPVKAGDKDTPSKSGKPGQTKPSTTSADKKANGEAAKGTTGKNPNQTAAANAQKPGGSTAGKNEPAKPALANDAADAAKPTKAP